VLEEAVALQLLSNLALAGEGVSLALGLIFSLVAAALFLPVVSRWGGSLGRILLAHYKVLMAGLRFLPGAGGRKSRVCCLKAGFTGCWRLLVC